MVGVVVVLFTCRRIACMMNRTDARQVVEMADNINIRVTSALFPPAPRYYESDGPCAAGWGF